MSYPTKCPTCQTELPVGALPGQCPRCLFGLGLEAAQAPQPRKGRHHFGGYELVAQLGCGGMGVVYEARQECLHRPVALKMILGAESCSPKTRRRFFIEAEAVARLDHPNIVQIYEVGEYEEQPFIAMKLVRGESLRDKMVRGEVGLTKNGAGLTSSVAAGRQKAVARLVATLARAVHHAHQHNVVHRDLKPENVLIEADGTPYLTDFGVAKLLDLDGSTAKTESIGTLAYMSPEQFNSDRITPATDIYSLGVNLFELLAGRVPFHEASRDETSRAIETQPPTRLRQLNRTIDKDLETICLKCLEKSPGSRYGTALELAADLENWLQGRPIKARPAGPLLRLGRWSKRNQMASALILSLFAGLLATMGLFVQIRKAEQERIAIMGQQLAEQVDEFWNDTNKTTMVLSPRELALLRGRLLVLNHEKLFTNAINIQANPVAQAMAYAPLLDSVQKQMSDRLKEPVMLSLKFCKNSQYAYHEIASGQADFQRLGAVSYVRLLEDSPGAKATVWEDSGKICVIFARKDSPITNLSGFKDHSFAFGDTNSTMSAWTKVLLVEAGVLASNLRFCANFNEASWSDEAEALEWESRTNAAKHGVEMVGGATAAWKVLDGIYDGAVLQRSYFERLNRKKGSLRAVLSFTNAPNVYVARQGLDPAVISAFQGAMLSIRDKELLGALPNKPPLKRFKMLDDRENLELTRLRAALTNEALRFDDTAPRPHPAQFRAVPK